jgi:hypothetical protein
VGSIPIRNQFYDPGDLLVYEPFGLCVPSIKESWVSFFCGDGVVNQPSEECDPPDDSACPGECEPDCTCPVEPFCGDGVVNQPSEACDGDDLAGETCESLGFFVGTLNCSPSCQFDTSECHLPDGAPCTSPEECYSYNCPAQDGVCCNQACDGLCESCALPGMEGTCDSIPYGEDPDEECPGTSTCDGAGSCLPEAFCGDGVVNQPSEVCDGSDDSYCPMLCQQDCTCSSQMCPEAGEPDACLAASPHHSPYVWDCENCCGMDPVCWGSCEHAALSYSCTAPPENAACANALNEAGCGPWCCP